MIAILVFSTMTVCFLIYYYFRTRISYKSGPFLKLVDIVRWYWPLQRRLEWTLCSLRLVEILRAGLLAGLPINKAVSASLNVNTNCCFQKRLSRWQRQIEQGADPSQSARACGIGESIAWALDAKINPGQAPVVLEMLEEAYRNDLNYLGNLIRAILWPVVVLLMGLFVGFVVLAMYLPMAQMINCGVEYITP
jgi:type II secretory pathway component PulF